MGVLMIGMCLAISGCGKKVNLAGIYAYESSSYTPVETGTFRVSSDELVNRRDHGGGKTSLFWGLLTYTDY